MVEIVKLKNKIKKIEKKKKKKLNPVKKNRGGYKRGMFIKKSTKSC